MTARDAFAVQPPREALETALASLDRRGFLRLVAVGAAAGILPSGCSAGEALGPPPGLSLAVLAPRTYATFNAAARSVVGPRGAQLIESGAIDPARLADEWLARLGPVAETFANGLWALELGVWPLVAKLRPFTALDSAAQAAALDDLMRSRLALKRRLFGAVKTFACLAFYAHPESHALAHYPGPFGAGGVAIADAMALPPEP